MFPNAQGIPGLPDITHPDELMNFGKELLSSFLTLTLIVGALGIILALISFSLRRNHQDWSNFRAEWLGKYLSLLRGFQHGILIIIFLVIGFFFCSTLANRYHDWEQAKIATIAASVAGERLEQAAPRVRYLIEEPYSYYTQVDGKLVKIDETRKVDRFLTLTSSEINVKIEQIPSLQKDGNNYKIDFTGVYQVTNSLPDTQELFFEVSPLYGYSLLQNLRVEQKEQRLTPINPGNYSFPISLNPGESSSFRVAYQAQGSPKWVYNAGGELLSNFRLTVNTAFPNADFASGIAPTEMKPAENGTVFTWIFEDNVSVTNPFGVFTATSPLRNTGIIPRLLLLAPALFLWWLLLVYLSLPLSWRNLAIAAGLFFACLLTLTYLSRLMDAKSAWAMISTLLLILVWGLGTNTRTSLAAIICTISGAIIPVLALLIPYTGLTLSLAGLLSVTWLVARHWYGFAASD